eukprot:6456095-Amphidinium_carterae.1
MAYYLEGCFSERGWFWNRCPMRVCSRSLKCALLAEEVPQQSLLRLSPTRCKSRCKRMRVHVHSRDRTGKKQSTYLDDNLKWSPLYRSLSLQVIVIRNRLHKRVESRPNYEMK